MGNMLLLRLRWVLAALSRLAGKSQQAHLRPQVLRLSACNSPYGVVNGALGVFTRGARVQVGMPYLGGL